MDADLSNRVGNDVVRAGGAPAPDGENEPVPLAIVCADSALEAVGQISSLNASEVVVVHTGDIDLAMALAALSVEQVSAFVHVSAAERCLYSTVRKLLSGDIFGLEKYLPAAPTRRLRIDNYSGRGLAIDAVMRAANSLGLPKADRESVTQAAEELLINGLYEAPVDDAGELVFAGISPPERLTRQSPSPVSLRYASTDQFFAIAVRDRFGRLDKDSVVAAIQKAHSEPAPAGRVLGSGHGLCRVVERATTTSFNVAANQVTEVVCTFVRDSVAAEAISFFHHRGRVDA